MSKLKVEAKRTPQTSLLAGFWMDRQRVNARRAIFHQWDEILASGCIENFRIAAGEVEGLREGWFFADSDAYKWLEAASRILAGSPDPRLAPLVDGLIALLGRAQMADGYLFTYNQIHFPGTRWKNLQIEHELYCHGHLIEAGVSHFQSTGRTDLLDIARRAADRVVADFRDQPPAYSSGHEEIELALLRLHEISRGDTTYLEMARQFVERRGRIPRYGLSALSQNRSRERRAHIIAGRKNAYLSAHPDYHPFRLPPDNTAKTSRFSIFRYLASALSGKYFQQHAPVRAQTVPVGHAVRFGYLEMAVAMLARLSGDASLLPVLEQAWERTVTRRMYVTGGLGSVPAIEGFGNDYELDPEYAYAETCAALASLFWNWEMAGLTGDAKYSDLLEWQLYNAAAVGMGLDGTGYLYNNPLACTGGIARRSWYAVPCCPPNLARTFANVGEYIFSVRPGQFLIHQYIGSEWRGEILSRTDGKPIEIAARLRSGLPWEGRARIELSGVSPLGASEPAHFDLWLRRPSWAGRMRVMVNASNCLDTEAPGNDREPTASGFDPRLAKFHPLRREWHAGDLIEIEFEMPLRLLRAHPRVKGHHGKVAVTRGPLVYCLEDLDNAGVDILSVRVDPNSLAPVRDDTLLDGIVKLDGRTTDGRSLTFIPYMLWGNRGPSKMTVWVRT